MILLIDHYDSFSAILTDYFKQLDGNVVVMQTDQISLGKIKALNPSHLVIGPGPGSPNDPVLNDVYKLIEYYHKKIPILGVCLGHQMIARLFGGEVVSVPSIHHGVISKLDKASGVLFQGISNDMQVTRYHSLMVSHELLPDEIKVMAECMETDSNCKIIMAIEHVRYPVYGIQFHPEAILTEFGLRLLENFLATKDY